jgi:molybdenum cofactor sulfurtransferase
MQSEILSEQFTKAKNEIENDFFEALRATEYPNLDAEKQVYLDYTGGNLYPRSLIIQHQELLLNNILGNPHSTNPTSQKATLLVEQTRQRIISFFNAEDYHCIFTTNASAALKIVGESYPFCEGSKYVLTYDNHNSVNGIRDFCNKKKGTTLPIPSYFEDLYIDKEALNIAFENTDKTLNNLFAFPAQSNASGVQYDLNLIAEAQSKGFDVLLDAAAFVPTSRLDLKKYQPEFVSLSFYKIFGYPTGIGCLFIKKSVFAKLEKPWFAGGTVSMVSIITPERFLVENHERFEDGTLNYNNIPAVKLGLDFIDKIGMDRIHNRVKSLAKFLFDGLINSVHDNGNPIVHIFGPKNFDNRGSNIFMNFFDAQGDKIPFDEVIHLTNSLNISIRSGCFCNPGIDEINYCITNAQMSAYFSDRTKGDYEDMAKFLGMIRGAIRVSVGMATNHADLNTFLQFVHSLKNRNL